MSEKQRGVTSEDRILDHLIDVRDTKIPLHQEDQGLDDLHVLGRVFEAVLMSTQRRWEWCLLCGELVFLPGLASTQVP